MKPTVFFRYSVFLVMFFSALQVFCGGGSSTGDAPSIVVYCYDSFSSEWGPGPAIADAFFRNTGILVEFNAPGDAVTVLNQVILEKDAPIADVVVGLDNSLLNRVLAANILDDYNSPELERVIPSTLFDPSHHLLPFDYGHFAICYDSQAIVNPPKSLEDLTLPDYSRSIVLMDPRTSTPGLGFLLWTVAVYGEKWPDYWRRLRPNILTIADGWSQGYTLFTAGEAPMVLSYGTSPVYHVEYEDNYRYKAAEFADGHPVQIEAMGIVKGTKNRRNAEAFIDFMLGAEAQYLLATGNIMLPVNPEVVLPKSFESALMPAKTVVTPDKYLKSADFENLIRKWREVFGD